MATEEEIGGHVSATFRPEISGISIPTFTIFSGDTLRKLHVTRQYSTQLNTWVAAGIEPSCVPPGQFQSLMDSWMAEAYLMYPQDGDYRVRLLDAITNERILIGSDVEFLVEEDQMAVTVCDTNVVPDCPDRRLVIQICNSNGDIDDNFDIYLNGFYIGAVDLSVSAQVGSIFIADLNPALAITDPDFTCPLNLMVVYRFDAAILAENNVIEMRNTQNNGMGNAGSVDVRNYLVSGNDLIDPCVVANLSYAGNSGVDFNLNFAYTQCCQ